MRTPYIPRQDVTISLPKATLDRLTFLSSILGENDLDALFSRMIHTYDRVVCASIIEGADVIVRNRNGRHEEPIEP